MERFYQAFREYPAIAGIGVFLLVSLVLAIVLGTMMLQAGSSLKPLVFFFGFLAIVGGPQAVVHVLDALAHSRAVPVMAPTPVTSVTSAVETVEAASEGLRPVAWESVFGPDADPSLMTDPRRGLEAIFSTATEARLSFNAAGESALAARFGSESEAVAALDRYGGFFQFAEVTGSDAGGWTGKRFGGQGEWNHVVAVGRELYAWTGPTRESVVSRRERVLGPLPEGATGAPRRFAAMARRATASRNEVSSRLTRNTPVMMAFLGINLCLAVGWFFKASAWSARVAPVPGVTPVDAGTLRERLKAVNHAQTPVEVTASADGRTWEATWRHADARWLDLMRAHQMRRTHKLVLTLDEAARTVRVREYWSALDASAGRDRIRLEWTAATGIQFFQVEGQRVAGLQLDREGKPTGELGATFRFNLQELKGPVIEAVTGGGWVWQPVVWNAPAPLRWLTE